MLRRNAACRTDLCPMIMGKPSSRNWNICPVLKIFKQWLKFLVSHHLKQLKSAGLIISRREGKEVYYKAADTEQAQTFHQMIEWLVKLACPSHAERQKGTPWRKKKTSVHCLQNGFRLKSAEREIHQQLTEHLDQRFTIEELSRQYLINTSTLKEVFKAVYGLPIATYMKEYRVRQAMKLLRESNAAISEISSQAGYETQGKFSKAFKDITHVLPTEYRKEYRDIHTTFTTNAPASQQTHLFTEWWLSSYFVFRYFR